VTSTIAIPVVCTAVPNVLPSARNRRLPVWERFMTCSPPRAETGIVFRSAGTAETS
jgi:hypothetical protein